MRKLLPDTATGGCGRGHAPATAMSFLVVEDQTIFRQLLRPFLERSFEGCRVTEAASLAEAKAAIKDGAKYDLAVVDLELPDGNALDVVIDWMAGPAKPKVVILSSVSQDYIVHQALHANIPGFVHKSDDHNLIKLAIEAVLANSVFYSPTVRQIHSRMMQDPRFFNRLLTEKEQEVLKILGQGVSNDEAAGILGMKEMTVKDHRRNIMGKLGIHQQAELIRYAVQHGFSHI
jgi:DNA-binding NarL/FixJ family response regulator